LPLTTACIAGVAWLAASGQLRVPSKNTVLAGVCLGIINFGSLYFLLETYDKINLARSGVMPVNNLGVILLSAAASVVFLGERLNPRNRAGLAMGAMVILLLLWESLSS
jgi:drug/metabolite transporter (DMT)-like permease